MIQYAYASCKVDVGRGSLGPGFLLKHFFGVSPGVFVWTSAANGSIAGTIFGRDGKDMRMLGSAKYQLSNSRLS